MTHSPLILDIWGSSLGLGLTLPQVFQERQMLQAHQRHCWFSPLELEMQKGDCSPKGKENFSCFFLLSKT